MFKADRVFSVTNDKIGLTEWYFQARQGNSGPYKSKQEAQLMLQGFVEECTGSGNTGGRNPNEMELSSNSLTQASFKFKPKDHWY